VSKVDASTEDAIELKMTIDRANLCLDIMAIYPLINLVSTNSYDWFVSFIQLNHCQRWLDRDIIK
jgi:hypothetical protein